MLKYYFTYILECADKSYYTGITNDIDRRIAEHNEGENPSAYTYSRRPVKLVYLEQFFDPSTAIELEKQIKGWSRKKKDALIANNWDKLKELSVCKNETSYMNYKKNKKMSS
ncbi:MAG: GIY-YIG nuclease family protein [Bacteroidetes bacterium]|nr:GIY-YIG nuclease family protein [Bacteroidota bacterium]